MRYCRESVTVSGLFCKEMLRLEETPREERTDWNHGQEKRCSMVSCSSIWQYGHEGGERM